MRNICTAVLYGLVSTASFAIEETRDFRDSTNGLPLTLISMPAEIQSHIISYLSEKRKAGSSLICKQWYDLSNYEKKCIKVSPVVTHHDFIDLFKRFPNLKNLDLAGNNIGTAGAAVIAQSPTLTNLTRLNLKNNSISATGAGAIARSATMKNLISLNLKWNSIGVTGAAAIAHSKALTNLTSLNLFQNKIGHGGAIFIAHSTTLNNLTSLNLGDNNIRAAGASVLAQSETLKISLD